VAKGARATLGWFSNRTAGPSTPRQPPCSRWVLVTALCVTVSSHAACGAAASRQAPFCVTVSTVLEEVPGSAP